MNITKIQQGYLIIAILYGFYCTICSLKNKKKLDIVDIVYFFYWPATLSFGIFYKIDNFLRKRYQVKQEKKASKMGFKLEPEPKSPSNDGPGPR